MEGQSLEQLFAGRGMDLDAMFAQMKARMAEEGLDYGQRSHTYNSRLAQEMGKWAETQEGGEAIHDAFNRAYFVDGRNIADMDVLLDVAETAGLSREAAAEVIETRSYREAVDEDWSKSRDYGVTGVPTFVAGGYGVVGAQQYEALEQLLTQAGAVSKE
jgi:predicted DsbA family dithiol-disulfide isomerase